MTRLALRLLAATVAAGLALKRAAVPTRQGE